MDLAHPKYNWFEPEPTPRNAGAAFLDKFPLQYSLLLPIVLSYPYPIMPYELFANKAAKFGAPQLTIRSGRIAFNADAGDILAKCSMKFVHILWDAKAHKIGIRPVTKEDSAAFKVTIPKGKRGGSFSALSFLNYIGWQADGPVVIAAEWNEKERILEASLPKDKIRTIDDLIKRGLGL